MLSIFPIYLSYFFNLLRKITLQSFTKREAFKYLVQFQFLVNKLHQNFKFNIPKNIKTNEKKNIKSGNLET